MVWNRVGDGKGSGAAAACAGDAVDAGAEWVEALESGRFVQWEESGGEGQEVVVGSE